MTTENVKRAILASTVLMSAGYAGSAAASTMTASITGERAGATDKFTLNCPDWTKSVYVDLDYIAATGNAANPGVLTLTLVKGNNAQSVSDSTPRTMVSTPNPGAGGYLNGGVGTYDIYVQRTTSGLAAYSFSYSCVSINSPPNAPTAIIWQLPQNPPPPLPNPGNN